jgi:Fe-S cluster assembly iron-binding protein IscA
MIGGIGHMLELSLGAAAYVDEARRHFDLPESAGLRIWVDDPQKAESPFHVGFTNAPDASDEVVERWGARVFIASELSHALTEQVLDIDDDTEPPHLVLRSQHDGAA